MKAKMKNVEIKERSIMDWAIQFVVTHQLKNKEQAMKMLKNKLYPPHLEYPQLLQTKQPSFITIVC